MYERSFSRVMTCESECRSRLLPGTLLVLASILWLVTGVARAQSDLTGSDITTAIESQFWADEAVDPNEIDVTTQEGIVTLQGTVDNILAKERAMRLTQAIVGVRAIVGRLKVEPVSRSDEELRSSVKNALFRDPVTDSYEVSVAVDDGVVALGGTVESWQEQQFCAAVAKGVKGVRSVENDIDVKYKAARSDYEIQQEVEARLANDVLVDSDLINVDVEDEKVSLSGTVGSLSEKDRARRDAWVAGVDGVDVDRLEIDWWARDAMRRSTLSVSRTDDKIREAVRDALVYDPRVLSFNPVIEVKNGAVTLTGVVDNLAAKRAAEDDARNVLGVRRVKNHLKVRPKVIPANKELEKRVASALSSDPFVERWDIVVDAYSGTVYLSGDVNTSYEKVRAERVTEGVKGVTYVINSIEYDHSWTWKRDQEIRENVKDELFWSPFVDANEVSVTVDNGVVTLTGKVDTWSERRDAGENAFEGGAKDVRNELTVKYRYYGPAQYDGFLNYYF